MPLLTREALVENNKTAYFACCRAHGFIVARVNRAAEVDVEYGDSVDRRSG